ncbi:surface-associated interspersed protein (SURFIN) [Plasmodium relictum]|uniref:Surface-associated interspersed protein (SURFIN) n=1 Tax=Plasmodium relictum TaxID=85471 RepID=A0A1J1GKJ3_PLARL|nr:surface-associated interspersed protein (SURFIN) [Plasmodium relictum]CRG85258.1 surface-associated interspersed protein (SURFIN) [Plasmodium relictum]
MDINKELNRKTRSLIQSLQSLFSNPYRDWKDKFTREVDQRLNQLKRETILKKQKRLCRDFNDWVDDTKEDFFTTLGKKLNIQRDSKTKWEENEKSIIGKMSSIYSCKRNPSKYNKTIRNKRRRVEDFCEERDERIGELNKNFTNQKCMDLNKWINSKKDDFTKNNRWSIDDSKKNNKDFEISKNCTLYNMKMFSSNIDCYKSGSYSDKTSENNNFASNSKKTSNSITSNTNTNQHTPTPKLAIKSPTGSTPKSVTTTSIISTLTSVSSLTNTPLSTNISPTKVASTSITTTSVAPTSSTVSPHTNVSVSSNKSPIKPASTGTNKTESLPTRATPLTPANTSSSTSASVSEAISPIELSTINTTTPVVKEPKTSYNLSISPDINKNTLNSSMNNSNLMLNNSIKTLYISTSNVVATHPSLLQDATFPNIISGNSTKTTSSGILPTLIILPIGGSLILFMFFFALLYKHTPIGSWFDNRKSKKKKKHKKQKEVQIDLTTSLAFPYKKLENNMKNLGIYEKNGSICEIRLENEVNIGERYGEEESKENENKEKEERIKKEEEHSKRNIETKINTVVIDKKWKWKAIIEIHMMVLEECQKEEWEFNRRGFLKICLDEFKEEGIYSDIIIRDLTMEIDQEKITSIFLEQKPLWKIWTEWNDKLIEKWKKKQWFKNLIEEWKKEVNKCVELIKEEMMEGTEKGAINPMLERQKIIWKNWIQKQKKSHIFNERLLKQLLVEYEVEEMKKNMETTDREKIRTQIEERNKAYNDSNKNKLISRLRIEIYMMVLDECKKEEWIRNNKEFFKECIEKLKMQDNSDEKKEILEIEEEIIKNFILEKKRGKLEKFKKEKWFIELKKEWMGKEKKYMEELNKENLLGNNEQIIENPMLQKQKIIWRKHWKDMHKKFLENENKNESFIKFMDEYNSKEVNRKESDKINVAEKNIKDDEIGEEREKQKYLQEKKEEINREDEKERKKKEQKIKHMEEKVEKVKEKSDCMILRKKPKRKTLIEIHMVIMEDCKQEEWELNRVEFLEICLNEWLKDEESVDVKGKEATMIKKEESSSIESEKQKILSGKWIERQGSMLEKWKEEEWFKNMKEEWKKEEKKYIETLGKSEIIDGTNEKNSHPTLERKKEIWKQWLQKQRELFMGYYKKGWFEELLEEYEFVREENEENVEEKENNLENQRRDVTVVDIKKEVNNKIKKEKLISNMCVEIHMMILDQCKKEEIYSMRNEFLRSYIEQKKERGGSYKQKMGNKETDKTEEEREMNIMIDKKKKQWECWKKEDWFQELKLDWKEEMKRMIKDTNKIKKEIINPMLETQIVLKNWQERQRNILKKRNKQNKHENSIKKNKDEEKIKKENEMT